uniref:FH2 domain-containing protein n=1 Tax=Dendroctonus ponderosae TaxID=77166 RepID=A0AAR5QKK1_DENPD
MSSYRNYYDSTFGRTTGSTSKPLSDSRSTPSRIATKYGGSYTSSIASTSGRSEPPRIKTILDKDTLHPPVSYKSPLSRATTRSREPSPSMDKSEKSTSSSSSYINPNRLYPRPYTRSSTSRESTVSPVGSTSNLPRLSSTKREDASPAKYGSGRASSVSKDSSIASKYKSSREDLSSGSQKYLNSRFLPKNSVERSFTAYSRPSAARTHEVSRKNKELLHSLHAQQEQEKFPSRPPSRCSSATPEERPKATKKPSPEIEATAAKEVEFETVKVCTRGTSPTLGSSTHPSFLRSRRIELAKTIEKTITRAKTIKENMIDKEIQSDRMDDSTRSSRFAGASRISATPWTNFLDMKFSSPNSKKDKKTKQDSVESPKSLSRTSSTKSIASVKSDKDREGKKAISIKSKLTPPRQLTDKKQLRPPIPKPETSNKPNSLHSLNTPNKDFRKSVLNMNPDGSRKKIGRRSNSASSAESDNADPDATDISENLTSCKSYHNNSSSSRLPQKTSENRQRSRASPGSDVSVGSTTGPSSSEEDSKSRKERVLSTNSSRTSAIFSSVDDVLSEPVTKVPPNSKLKGEGNKNETEAKNFLMRALAPVTNLFKTNRQSTGNMDEVQKASGSPPGADGKVTWILDPSSESALEPNSISQQTPEPRSAKLILHRVESDQKGWWEESTETASDPSKLQQRSEPVDMKYGNTASEPGQRARAPSLSKQDSSGETPWWLDSSQAVPDGMQIYSGYNAENNMSAPLSKPAVRHNDSGEKPWWLDEEAPVPEGVETYAGCSQQNNNKKSTISHVQSGEKPWWLDENPTEVPEGVQVYPNYSAPPQANEESQPPDKYRIRTVESGEAAWWLKKDADPPEGVKTWPNPETAPSNPQQSKPTIRHVESGESPWWLQKDSTPPEGVQTYPNWAPEPANGSKFKRNDSGNSTWWQDSDKSTSEQRNVEPGENKQPECLETHKLRHIDSGEREWWINDDETSAEVEAKHEIGSTAKYAIRHQDSGEKAWWLQDNQEFDSQEPLGDRASPEGLEMPKDTEAGRLSPYDNVPMLGETNRKGVSSLFISKHTNIDDILGGTGQLWSPIMNKIFDYQDDADNCREVDAREVIIHEGSKAGSVSNRRFRPEAHQSSKGLDDAALQLYKDGDYGSYLDLEASISEQQEEFEGFQSNKKNSIVLRTQLSVRVHTIIEKLLTSEGRELRRALFSLKQIFQEDKDLVHEFVQNDGLSCLIKVGSEADQNYQNYILRALGQVMLYVDGMNGVMEHNQTIQWLYSLISSRFRLVVKTALKLLLVFVEYTDSNCMLLVKAIRSVDCSQGLLPYHNIMKLLKDFDAADTELLIYATTLINKILNGVPDQDVYYDQVDALEEQEIESIVQRYMSKPGTDLDLLQQFQIYEAVLQYEDGEDKGVGAPLRHLDENLRKTIRSRKSIVETTERRKSRRHSTGTTPIYGGFTQKNKNQSVLEGYDESSSSSEVNNAQLNGSYKESNTANEAGVTPALKRRRERAERQRSFMREQQETAALLKGVIQQNNNEDINNIENNNGHFTNALQQRLSNGNNLLNKTPSRKDMTPYLNAVNRMESEENLKQPWIMSMIQNHEGLEESDIANENERNILMQLKKENTVKDITQKLANQSILQSPTEEKMNRFGDMCGLISKAKEGLAKSKSKADVLRSPTHENLPKIEAKKSENELRWEELVANLNRPLNLCDMDFTDLMTDDEADILTPVAPINGIPPPPPPLQSMGNAPPPPPPTSRIPTAPPPVPNAPLFGVSLTKNSNNKNSTETRIPIKKNKKTVKLFWKEVRDDPISQAKLKSGYIWDELNPVIVDTQKLEHLFESRAKDLISKKQQELNKNKEIIVLDPKRSNAINIGMTKLPPPRSIKTAILKMDATIMNREGIEKLLTMLPTEEERTKIQDAQAANPDLPLGSAEQFLLTLASISELPARLKLWAFKLDFENSEREIAEPLMDLKQGFEVLRINKTFRAIISTLLSIGNFLNGNEVKGFQIDYLTKVPEVKDTVHKHSLLHHLCHIVMEKFPEASDLYSEIGAITRASKVDFDELTLNIQKLEADCKASWDHLKLIAKHDGSTMMKVKMSDFLADCAERIILVGIIHRRIMNRFHKFLLWLGIPFHQVADTKPNEFCRIVSEFALEYRTTRERVLQQLEKKANHRERNKTRGKMITDVSNIGKFRSKEDRADAELRQLLGSDISDVESMQGTLPWRHRRRESASQNNTLGRNSTGLNGHLTDGDDEILESLVKTATKGPRTAPRERKRTRHVDRKSFKRSRTRENNPYGSRDSP